MNCVPLESKPHLRTLMAWPDITSNPEAVGIFNKKDLRQARKEIASIANAIAKFEPVWLYAKPSNVENAKTSVSSGVTVKSMEVDQLWLRDTGPVFVSTAEGKIVGVDTNFNYWGQKFDVPGAADRSVARKILEEGGVPRIQALLITEGGALEFDGEGTLMATESSIVNANRNPGKTRTDLEQSLQDTFGVKKVIWLEGAEGIDSTDCHVDALARFAPDNTILLSRPHKSVPHDDIQYRLYKQARSVLEHATDVAGKAFDIVEIEEAECLQDEIASGELPCLSYVNYYLPTGGVIVPIFGDSRTDALALKAIKKAWPGREMASVKLDWMAWCGGGVHCATQQWPLGS